MASDLVPYYGEISGEDIVVMFPFQCAQNEFEGRARIILQTIVAELCRSEVVEGCGHAG